MAYVIEDMGTPALGDCWLAFRHGRNPLTGAEVVLGSLSRGGFAAIDPKTRSFVQIQSGRPFACAWAVAQGVDGLVYQADSGMRGVQLCVWDWKSPSSRVVADPPAKALFTIDVAPDGCVYMPDYTGNVMYRYEPAGGKIDSCGSYGEFGQHIRNVFCGRNGIVYVTSLTYNHPTKIVALDPATGRKWVVNAPAAGLPGGVDSPIALHLSGELIKDCERRVLAPARQWGRSVYFELVGGEARPLPQESLRVTAAGSPLVFMDGGYIEKIDEKTVHYVDPTGKPAPFDVDYKPSPLRIFSIESGGGRIWGGTFIPLSLFSFDPATGKPTYYGNPTETGGEIYSMVWSADKLFMGSYYGAHLDRYDPSRPWRKDKSARANPATLGQFRSDGQLLQRPYGRAIDSQGFVYFAAMGGYGCVDSGIARIDPVTEEVTRWIYPNTTMGVMSYVKAAGQLLLCERREGEKSLRFTFVRPQDGSIAWSEPVIADEGLVHSWLDSGGDLIYGLHGHRATLFAFSLSQKKIVSEARELGLGDNCYNALAWGPDGRIWGLTDRCVYAADPKLEKVEKIADYSSFGVVSAYRFGMYFAPDGSLYFPNGTQLLRVRKA